MTPEDIIKVMREAYRDGYEAGYAHLIPADDAFDDWYARMKARVAYAQNSRTRRSDSGTR
jgi:hypothetical protein